MNHDYTAASRMRRYRARRALIRALERALATGNYPHQIRGIVETWLQNRNGDPRYGARPASSGPFSRSARTATCVKPDLP